MNRLASSIVWAVALLAGCHRLSTPARQPAWVLVDPAGDDHGDGNLRLPGNGEPAPGELDLLALRAFPGPGGLELEVEFARPVLRPDARVVAPTGETLEGISPLGFWALNLDLYVDLDLVAGSGRTDMLPGRLAEVAPETAWERVICLTPRPAEARAQLATLWTEREERRRAEAGAPVDADQEAALQRDVQRELEERVFFPRRVVIAGPTIRFQVPATFLPPEAAARAAWLGVVTAADHRQRVDVAGWLGRPSSPPLFNLTIGPGGQLDRLGGARPGDARHPPVVDVLLDGVQEVALRARPAVLRGVVPTP